MERTGKLLHFALLAKGSPQLGLISALRSICWQYREFDWKAYGDDIDRMHADFVQLANEFQPDVCFLQVQTAGILPPAILQQVPGVKIEWNGDCRNETPFHSIERAAQMDCTCFSNMRDVEKVRAAGFPAEFLNIGFSPSIFTPDGPKRERTPPIIFCGNHYPKRFPCTELRQELVILLQQNFGSSFAVFGRGWWLSQPWLSEPDEAAAYRACQVAIDLNHYCHVPRFFSDRRLRIMASGAFCIANHNPGIEEDFEIGKHLVTFKNIKEVPSIIRHYLACPKERLAIAKAGREHVHRNHSWMARMTDLRRIVDQYAKVPA